MGEAWASLLERDGVALVRRFRLSFYKFPIDRTEMCRRQPLARWFRVNSLLLAFLMGQGLAHAAPAHRAAGILRLPQGATVLVMPMDVELYSLTAGGVAEPKADWTELARNNLAAALEARGTAAQVTFKPFQGASTPELAELSHLARAVANVIWSNHFGPWNLPGKAGQLDWTLGEEVSAITGITPGDYALYVYLHDYTTTGGRKVAMAAWALLGVGLRGGGQAGDATLVDLKTGAVVWYNRLLRETGDVREPDAARKTLDQLLEDFPG